MKYPRPVVELIGAIMERLPQADYGNTGSTLLERIQGEELRQRQETNPEASESSIQGIGYFYGHPQEIIQRLKEMSESPTGKYQMWPAVFLFTDVKISPSSVKGLYGDVSLNMVIAYQTQPDFTAADRMEKNFLPILRPIYEELIYAIAYSGYFWVQSPKHLLGNDTDRLYWGREAIYGNDGNIFNDRIDAIEIKNLTLTINN